MYNLKSGKVKMMGCSSSMSAQLSKKKPIEHSKKCPQEVPIHQDKLNIESNTKMHIYDSPKDMAETKPGENIHINNTRILIIARDPQEKDSTDASSIVPIFNDQESRRPTDSCSPCFTACTQLRSASAGRDTRSMSLPGGIKSVLKTGRNDPRNHMLANRPIKTVTFVESVTVVTVF